MPRSATAITSPAVTVAPSSRSVPAPGREVMTTALRVLAGLSSASAKPKSTAVKARVPSSATVMVASVPVGASLTLLTVSVTAFSVRLPAASVATTVKL